MVSRSSCQVVGSERMDRASLRWYFWASGVPFRGTLAPALLASARSMPSRLRSPAPAARQRPRNGTPEAQKYHLREARSMSSEPTTWQELRDTIPALRHQTYLNTGVSGPPPAFALEEELRWTRWLAETGPGRPDVMQAAFAELDRVRATLARFTGAAADEVALTQSCSNGMAVVAAGLDWRPGDEVLVSEELEHMSGLLPWYDLERRRGVVVRTVPAREGAAKAEDFEGAITDRTKLICMSHVAYNTGTRLPVEEVARLARERGVLLLVDGAQGPGNVPVDV